MLAARAEQGFRFAERTRAARESGGAPEPQADPENPLEAYFDANLEGPGIWKWRHCFEIYHRHFAKFVGRDVHVCEIGVYSGGSLPMWREYFGPGCHVYGVDIEEACRAYEDEGIEIWIGDQADPEFWAEFRRKVPDLDIVIDDGGHRSDQQIATLEALLPHLRPGGVYLCEDIAAVANPFAGYLGGLEASLDAIGDEATGFQRAVHSIHRYPLAVVIERRDQPAERFEAPRHGTEWQPFLTEDG